MTRHAWLTGLSLCLLLPMIPATAAENWHQWRGPRSNGHTTASDVPVTWTADSVAWKTTIPGVGQSTPVMWGNRIFLTSASSSGNQRHVFCIDRTNGTILWQQKAWEGEAEPSHSMNNRASATCVTDGERVVAFFGRGGIHCYDLDGELLWSKQLSTFPGPWGTAASPIIVGGLVIQNCDADETAFITALDKKSGKQAWKVERQAIRGWSSPIAIQVQGRDEVVLNGHSRVTAYNPTNGETLWTLKTSNGRGTPTVTPTGEFLVALCGLSGDMVAVRPGGDGEVSDSRVLWRTPRMGGRDLPSPIVVGNFLLIARLRPGVVTCYDVTSGTEVWTERMEGGFSSSPIVAGGLVYATNESGTTYVIKPGPKPDVVATNFLGQGDEEIFRASPTPFDGHLLIRSDRVLYCVSNK
jgi:outer membrane protein assembly factor BamB